MRKGYLEDAPPPKTYSDPLNPPTFLYQWWSERGKQVAAVRELAAREASRHPPQPRPFKATADPKEFEEQSCLLHELALRGRDVSAWPGADAHADRMRERGHPLAWLALAPLPPDADIGPYLPRFGHGGFSLGGTSSPPPPVRAGGPGDSSGGRFSRRKRAGVARVRARPGLDRRVERRG
ncbi:MAG: hypothetical protein K2V38_21575 [Gemmataceae bacterium]|nr:hypothetical protein [Gemmataceae bacterium]